mmetsp:Transcript_7441/g.11118  ORF Transcript_7441/g.11118 Transcript_7441/m.11118 type:complete len:618 (+) Transcript_7441:28-1881(+)
MVEVVSKDVLPVFADESFESISVVGSTKTLKKSECVTQTDEVPCTDAETWMETTNDVGIQVVMKKEKGEENLTLPGSLLKLVQLMEEEIGNECIALEEYEPLSSQDTEQEVKYKYTLTCPRIDSESPLQCVGLSWNSTGKMLCAAFGRRDLIGWCEDEGYLCAWNIFQKDFNAEKPNFILEHSSCLTTVCCHPQKPALVAAGSFYGEILLYDFSKSRAEEPLIASSDIDDYFHREPISGLAWIQVDSLTRRNAHQDNNDIEYQLVSISADGKLLFWSLETICENNKIPKLPYPVNGMLITRPDTKTGVKSKHIIVGATALEIPTRQKIGKGGPISVLIGSEAGRILRCHVTNPHNMDQLIHKAKSKHTESPARWDKSALELLARAPPGAQNKLAKHVENFCSGNAIIRAQDIFISKPKSHLIFSTPQGTATAFKSHIGPVTQFSCSPFQRNLFASVSTDGKLNIFSTLNTKPLLSINPAERDSDSNIDPDLLFSSLYCIDWSKARPLIFAVAGDYAKVRIYDLENNPTEVPLIELPIPQPSAVDPSYASRCRIALCMQFNPRIRDFLACGDAGGRVHVWQLPWKISNARKNESQILDSLIDSLMKEKESDDEDYINF